MFGLPNPYVLMGAAGFGALLIVGSFVTGARYEHKNSKIDEMKTELAIAKADVTNAKLAEVDAREKTATLESEALKDQEKIDALEAEVVLDPGVCRVTGPDLDRLWGPAKR